MAVTSCGDGAAGPNQAGPADAARSVVTASLTSVMSGATSSLVLQTRDAAGRALTRGGHMVVFQQGGGSSTGTVSAATDRGDGSYEATFFGVLAGSATTIGATVDGVAVTSPLPAVRVRPGAFSPVASFVSVTPPTISVPGTAMLRLTTRDAAGNALDSGGLSVVLSASGGTATGMIGPTTDEGDGTYVAPFTATRVGSPLLVSAVVDGIAIESAPSTVSVARGISVERSTLAVAYDTVSLGAGTRVTLQVRDSSDIPRTSGGESVEFFVVGGTDGGDGTLDAVADHDDGTYTSIVTGTRPGTVTLGARVNGRSKPGPQPAITIAAAPVTAQQSTVTVSASTIVAGDSATFTAQLRDLDGTPANPGGASVRFSLSADGTSAGNIGATRDLGGGRYAATFVATTAGSSVTVGAVVGDSTQIQMLDSLGISHLPGIVVAPGVASPDSSRLAVDPARIGVGESATIRLVSRDAFGNVTTAGEAAVAFARAGGSGVSVGHIGPVTDQRNGTYTAAYIGEAAGLPDAIGASLDGHALASPLPTITVVDECDPGPVSVEESELVISDASTAQRSLKSLTISSGVSTTATVRLLDAAQCAIEGPHDVVVTAGGGTSTGLLGDVVDLGGGTYSVTFTGFTAGTPTTLTAAVDGAWLTSAPVTVAVIPGDISTHTSRLDAATSTLVVGDSTTLTLVARDAAGNRITQGGRAVTFLLVGSNAGGVIGATIDRGDGTYVATYLATKAGVTATIVARVDGTPVSDGLVVTIAP